MTARAAFDAQLKRLLGLRFVPASLDTHWEALQDVPLVVLSAAVSRAQKIRSDFPTPHELRQDADQVAHLAQVRAPAEDRAVPLDAAVEIPFPEAAAVLRIRETWNYYCETCSDSGWASVWCGPFTAQRKPWQEPRVCDRRGEHGSHEWVRRCPCWETNPALVRKRDAQRKYAEQKARDR